MVKVRRSTIIDAPVDEVWRILRDFNGHADWHPAVAASAIEGNKAADEVGCVRRFRLADGGELREQLLALSDRDRSFTYCILQAPMPLRDYVATVTLRPVTDGRRTYWEWRSQFEAPDDQAAELAALVGDGIYEAGFAAIRGRLNGGASARGEEGRARPRVVRAEEAAAQRRAPAPAAAGAVDCGAVVLQAYGGPEQLRWQRVSAPPPGPGQVRLRHTAVGLNFIDIYCRTGYFRLAEPPAVLGMEAAGIVTDVGPGVHGLRRGDRVAYACPPVGAYTEQRTMDAALLAQIPDGIDDETAAAVMLKGMTAEFLLHRVHPVREGEVVLVHAAAGGVGLLLCQWATHLGATVIGTVGSEDKAALARRNGCAYPIVYAREDFVARVMELTNGRGADVIYDAVGRDTFMKSYEALATRGHLVSYGQASGPIEPIPIAQFDSKSARVSRPNYGHYAATPEAVRAISQRLFDALRRGILHVEIGQRFPLREAAEAHRRLEARATVGSTVLLP